MESKRVWRQINAPLNKPRRLDSVFWWLAGIALWFFFLACVVLAYRAYHSK